jgi:hypothetical protein
MKTWAKRSLISVGVLIVLCVIVVALLFSMFRGTPQWYRAVKISAAEREKFAHSAENKLISAQNWAQEIVADGARSAHHRAGTNNSSSAATTRATRSHEITFSEAELNALLDKWSTIYGWGDRISEYLQDPQIVLNDGRLILAGKLTQIGAVTSFQFHPAIDANGQLHLDLVRVTAGRLPLPDAVWTGWQDRIVAALKRRIPQWQAQAQIDSSGAANFPAIAVTLSRLVFDVANHQPANPILFLPLAGQSRSAVPVRVTRAQIDDGKLTLDVATLSPAERADLLARIKSDHPSPLASNTGAH